MEKINRSSIAISHETRKELRRVALDADKQTYEDTIKFLIELFRGNKSGVQNE